MKLRPTSSSTNASSTSQQSSATSVPASHEPAPDFTHGASNENASPLSRLHEVDGEDFALQDETDAAPVGTTDAARGGRTDEPKATTAGSRNANAKDEGADATAATGKPTDHDSAAQSPDGSPRTTAPDVKTHARDVTGTLTGHDTAAQQTDGAPRTTAPDAKTHVTGSRVEAAESEGSATGHARTSPATSPLARDLSTVFHLGGENGVGGEDVRVAWREYGNPDAHDVLVCAHGYTRNKSDFDVVGETFGGEDRRVVSSDFVGRGDSEDFSGATSGYTRYNFGTSTDQMQQLFDHLGLEGKSVSWLGTSKGGVVGMMMAGKPNSPIERLVMNDVGPELDEAALKHLGESFEGDDTVRFDDLDQATDYFRARMSGFGELSDEQWRSIAEGSVRPMEDGTGLRPAYDPAVTRSFRDIGKLTDGLPGDLQWKALSNVASAPLRDAWRRIGQNNPDLPVTLLHGVDSPVLTPAIIDRATSPESGGPSNVDVVHFEGVGHAPSLMTPGQLEVLDGVLSRPLPSPGTDVDTARADDGPSRFGSLQPRLPTTKGLEAWWNTVKLPVELPSILTNLSATNARAVAAGSRPSSPSSPLFERDGNRHWARYQTAQLGGREVHWQVPQGEAPERGFPLAVLLPGSLSSARGYFYSEDGTPFGLEEQTRLTEQLLGNGYAVFAPEYAVPHTFSDANTALNLLSKDAPDASHIRALLKDAQRGRFGKLDAGDAAAIGVSSGGYLTSQLGNLMPEHFQRGLVVVSAGHFQATPMDAFVPSRLPAAHPRTLFLHGEGDPIVPVSQSRHYAKRLREHGVTAEHVAEPKTAHGWKRGFAERAADFLQRGGTPRSAR